MNAPAGPSPSPSPSPSPYVAHATPFALMVAMLGLLASVASASIDAYLPAFSALQSDFQASQSEIQLTLGVYMLCYACMQLLHGTLSDALGRRRVVLAALLVHVCGSLVALGAPSLPWLMAGRVLQGVSAGACVVIAQAIVQDCYQGSQARRAMSYLIVVINLSPALAPVVGGYLTTAFGWRAVFALLALLAGVALLWCAVRLPETLPPERRHALSLRALAHNVRQVLCIPRFTALCLVASLLVAAQGLLIGGAPDLLVNSLQLPATAFGYLFIPLVIGAVVGALSAARGAGYWPDKALIVVAYGLMAGGCLVHVLYLAWTDEPRWIWTVLPPALFTCGLAMCAPFITLKILGEAPHLSGTAASVLGFLQMLAFSLASGWLVALVYGRPAWLALGMLVLVLVSAAAWLGLQKWVASPRSGA